MVAEPTTAEERAAWPIFGGLPTVKEQIHRLIADVERLEAERGGVWAASVASLAESQADVEALTKQLDEARVVMRHYVDHVRSHGHADSDAEAMEVLLGAGAEEAS